MLLLLVDDVGCVADVAVSDVSVVDDDDTILLFTLIQV